MSTIQLRGDGSCVEVHPDGTVTALPIAGLVAPVVRAAAPLEAPAAPSKTSAKSTKRTTRTIVAELRARLREVERDIKVRKALEEERAQIKRLIDAATGKTPAPVRTIARTG
jgi:hypothetical protein